jgi:putative salt-induced outer membrane protein
MRYGGAAVIGVAVFCCGVPARAQAPAPVLPGGTLKQDAASKGVENVVSTGFESSHRPSEGEALDATELKVSAGGMSSGGNSRTLGLTGSARFRLRRGMNEVSEALVANYGRSAAGPNEPMETTVENLQGRLRYDRYVSGPLALFLGVSGLHDRFQGLDLRLNVDPGVAYYLIDEKLHRLWPELGYDFQYDVRRQETIDDAAAAGQLLSDTAARHSVRAFLGYENGLAGTVDFDTGIEFLKSLSESENWRLNWDTAFHASVGGDFSLAVTLSLKYDNNPLPGIRDTDLTSALSLVYQVL